MRKGKKTGVVIGFLTAAVLGVGVTMALLNFTTDPVTNTFASSKSVSVQLREPGWDGYEFSDDITQSGAGVKPGQEGNKALGYNQAKAYVPGQVIPKNPTVKNNGTQEEAIYTAIKVAYYAVGTDGQKIQMSYEDFKNAYLKETGIAFSPQWKPIGDSGRKEQIYIYGTAAAGKKLEPGETAEALFENVPLSLDLELGTDGKLPEFEITVTGYAVQASNVAEAEAGNLLLDFIGTVE